MKWLLWLAITFGGWTWGYWSAVTTENLQLQLAAKQDKCSVSDVASAKWREVKNYFSE